MNDHQPLRGDAIRRQSRPIKRRLQARLDAPQHRLFGSAREHGGETAGRTAHHLMNRRLRQPTFRQGIVNRTRPQAQHTGGMFFWPFNPVNPRLKRP